MNVLPIKKNIDVTCDTIQLWYPTLWRHKAPFFIYQFHDSFMRRCREILTRESLTPITKEAIFFLRKKDKLYIKEDHTYFGIYGFEGMPFLVPRFDTNRLFVSKLCRQYLYWSFFFNKSIRSNLY
jgi:hypothetical protein